MKVWMVRYDESLYLFKDLDAVQISIRDMFPTDYSVEKEVMSPDAVAYIIMQNGRVQDRIAAGLYEVHEKPTVIRRFVTPLDEDYDRPPRKLQEF